MSIFFSLDASIYGQTALPQDENSEYKIDSLFVALLKNGDASIDFNLIVNPNKSSTNVTLYGETVQNLTLADYNASNIRYTLTEESNKIMVHPQDSPDIHVTYTTPDLVDKQNRNWTFSIFLKDRFLLKIPSDAHIVHMEPPPFLTPTGDQNLWGFGPGKVQVSYVIGPLGTREEAQASIRSVESYFKTAKIENDGIVLSNSSILIDKANQAYKQGKYLETLTLTTKASDSIHDSIQLYTLGKNTILQAENEIEKKRNIGTDISEANQTISMAIDQFLEGEYEKSIDFASMAINQSNQKQDRFIIVNSNISLILAVIVIGSISLLVYFIKRKVFDQNDSTKHGSDDRSNSYEYKRNDPSFSIQKDNNVNTSIPDTKVKNMSPLHINMMSESPNDESEIKDYLKTVVKEIGNVRKNHEQGATKSINPPPSEEHSSDKEPLSQTILRMKQERPHLRSEDKDLLDFLCEREGSAFESEIRNQFILPRTSLWRLIKRLEREELVEVMKIGGQNLVKLKFEDNST